MHLLCDISVYVSCVMGREMSRSGWDTKKLSIFWGVRFCTGLRCRKMAANAAISAHCLMPIAARNTVWVWYLHYRQWVSNMKAGPYLYVLSLLNSQILTPLNLSEVQ